MWLRGMGGARFDRVSSVEASDCSWRGSMGDVFWEIFWERTTLFFADDDGLSLPPLASAIVCSYGHVLGHGATSRWSRRKREEN